MKKTITIIITLLFVSSVCIAQDTMYVMQKLGGVIKIATNNVDSVIFYKPIINSVTDIDGNIYNTVTIGTQTWMKENLKVTKYNDGTAIPLVTNNTEWNNLPTPAYCWYNNDAATNKNLYGALYNWYTVSTGKLCLAGWHIPTDSDWTTLSTYLGGESVAGDKMKEVGITHWNCPNTSTDNSSGFTALPAGYRGIISGNFYDLGYFSNFWSSTEVSANDARYYKLFCFYSIVEVNGDNKYNGFSVRCIQDN